MTEVHIDVKTTRGYLLHLFCVGFTKEMQQSDLEDLLCPAPAGLPGPLDDENCDSRGADKS